MKKTSLAILTTVVLLNTACSPKQDSEPSSFAINASSTAASSETMTATSSQPVATETATYNPTNAELQDTYWKLVLLNETEIRDGDSQREAHLTFGAESRVSGSDGCNNVMGTYTLTTEELTFSQMAGTKMVCESGAEGPQAFNDALAKVARYSVHSDQLELRDTEGTVIARFKAVDKPN